MSTYYSFGTPTNGQTPTPCGHSHRSPLDAHRCAWKTGRRQVFSADGEPHFRRGGPYCYQCFDGRAVYLGLCSGCGGGRRGDDN